MTTSSHSDDDAGTPHLDRLLAPGWARVERLPLVRREVRESLSAGAIDVLFAEAEHVVEGSPELGDDGAPDDGRGRVYATIMVTLDLSRSARVFREPPDAGTAQRLTELMADDTRVRDRLERLARPELARLAGVGAAHLEVAIEAHVRSEGATVLIDVDAMGTVDDTGEIGG